MAGFAGYIAVDELYDGPFCVLSLVDNRGFRRLTYRVLDHDPKGADVAAFLEDFKRELDARGLALRGITTDGSPLYPQPIAQVFGPDVRHQVCRFHVLRDLTRAVLHALARIRKQLTAKLPPLPNGRPARADQRRAARVRRRRQRLAELFEHRHLLVVRELSDAQRRTLRRITGGLPKLRALRQIMEQVYGLFDRRCRSETALANLAQLRQRVQLFKGVGKTLQPLFSTNLEKALCFLDDELLPSTSNAVERGNRRYRKMQKSVYRVRTRRGLRGRIALDLLREARAPGRCQTLLALRADRAGGRVKCL